MNKVNISVLIIVIVFTVFISNIFVTNFSQKENPQNTEKPKLSWFWATLDLINPGEVNNSMFTHYSSISIKGRLYNKISG
ncbi:unnamed protein product, partial [marine sediment metagenome]